MFDSSVPPEHRKLHHRAPQHKHIHAEPLKLSFWVMGIGSVLWLLWRSGTNPKRLAYPCQQAAAASAVAFLTYVGSILGVTVIFRWFKRHITLGRFAALVAAGVLLFGLQSILVLPPTSALAVSPNLPAWISPSAVSSVFAVSNVPVPQYSLNGGVIPAGVTPAEALHDDGVDELVSLMETQGDYFYKTAAHPNGLFGSNDVIVIKISNQWGRRNGTNTDAVKGIIYRLIQHPEGFTGAVIVAENAQNQNPDWANESVSNSQFLDQSYQEVTQAFTSVGYKVCLSNWDTLRSTFVADYDTGNNTNGYVVEDADTTPEELGHNRLSYPKFQLNCNGLSLAVSLKNGIWNGASFDNSRLKLINMPVLKRHNSAWATISIKNYMGFATSSDPSGNRWEGTSWHCWTAGPMDNGLPCPANTINYALIGRQLARIRSADLNLVDAIWVNPRDNAGYNERAVRQDVLLASRDPFAADYYASEFILYPLVAASGDFPNPEHARASYHGGWFRNMELRTVARLRAEGVMDTINIDDSLTRDQELAQFSAFVVDVSGQPVNTPTSMPPTSTLPPATATPGSPTATATRTQIPPTSTALPPTATPSADLIFRDGFESSNFSAWTSATTDNGDLSVSAAAALAGGYGMRALLDDNNGIYVTDDTPNAEPRLRLRFYFDPNALAMANGNAFYLLQGFSGTTTPVLALEFRRQSGYQLRIMFRNDSGAGLTTAWVTLSDAPHSIELDWRAATPGGNNGGLTLWLDTVQQANMTGVDNDAFLIDRVQLGVTGGVDTGTRGAVFFDAYESRRLTYIGAEPGALP